MKYQQALLLDASPCSVEALALAQRDRSRRQLQMISRYRRSLLTLTLVLPGLYRRYTMADWAFDQAVSLVRRQLRRNNIYIVERRIVDLPTGQEGYFIIQGDLQGLRKAVRKMTEECPLGQFMEIQLQNAEGHMEFDNTVDSNGDGGRQLVLQTAEQLANFFAEEFANQVAGNAVKALLYEVAVTPKPGLVDRANNGAHQDMDIFTFYDSTVSLYPYFRHIVRQGLRYNGDLDALLEKMRFTGQEAEDAMLQATNGINTHKGAIFTLGLGCAAVGYLRKHNADSSPQAVLEICGKIAAPAVEQDLGGEITHGETVRARYGLTGVREEAAAGYPSVWKHSYPAFLQHLEKGENLNNAGVAALLHLIANVEDTNIAHRAGPKVLEEVRVLVRDFLNSGPTVSEILRFASVLDQQFIERNLSPGGCADLLALTMFLHFHSVESEVT